MNYLKKAAIITPLVIAALILILYVDGKATEAALRHSINQVEESLHEQALELQNSFNENVSITTTQICQLTGKGGIYGWSGFCGVRAIFFLKHKIDPAVYGEYSEDVATESQRRRAANDDTFRLWQEFRAVLDETGNEIEAAHTDFSCIELQSSPSTYDAETRKMVESGNYDKAEVSSYLYDGYELTCWRGSDKQLF